jgi:hypothetical protein
VRWGLKYSLTLRRLSKLTSKICCGPTRKGSFSPLLDPEIPPHTLILGTQPSDNALAHQSYYMTGASAFWYIVGDALGFRRGWFAGDAAQAPPSIRPHLLHSAEHTLSYHEAVRRLTSSGYAV